MKQLTVLLCLLAFITGNSVTAYNILKTEADLRLESISSVSPSPQAVKNYRLPNDTEPISYDLKITTNLTLNDSNQDLNFTGSVAINLTVIKDTDVIVLNARHLDIIKIQLNDEEVESYTLESDTELLTINLREPIPAKSSQLLQIEYFGSINSNAPKGFYFTTYQNGRNESKLVAATQIAPINAREVFPCYDEPKFRARFILKLHHRKELTANSNMPVKEISAQSDDSILTTFEETPSMPTYLLAWTLSEFSYIATHSADRLLQRVFARPEAVSAGLVDFSLHLGVKVFESQLKFFDVDFPLPKLDQISIPIETATAMENWGLVIFRDDLLLLNQRQVPLDLEAKHRIVKVVSHEFAHQFFGNLVTFDFWEYVWLKEGFATLYEYYFANIVHPELQEEDFFFTECMLHSLIFDTSPFVTAMTHYREAPSEIFGAFSFVSYQKSAVVLNMLKHAMGEEVFTQAVKYYLDEMSFKAATDKDLVRNFHRVINREPVEHLVPIQQILDSWTLQPGYPILMVHTNEDLTLSVYQLKFGAQSESSKDFHIPVSYTDGVTPDFETTAPKFWLNQTSDILSIPGLENNWIIFNIQGTGYYRVNYDEHLWNRIIEKLKSTSFVDIHKYNRALLISDSFAAAVADMHPYALLFGVLAYLDREREFVAWKAADDALKNLHRQLSDSYTIHNLNRFIYKLTEKIYSETEIRLNSQTLDSRQLTQINLDTIVIDWACKSGNQQCLNRASRLVINDLEKDTEIDLTPRDVLYCHAIRGGNSTLFTRVWDQLLHHINPSEFLKREQLIDALGCSNNPNDLMKYLNSTLDANKYPPGEQNKVLHSVFRNGGPLGVELSIDFISLNYQQIEKVYPEPTPVLIAINYMVEFVTSERLNEKFLVLLDELVAVDILNESIKTIFASVTETNAAWLVAHEEEIHNFFKEYFDGGAVVASISAGTLCIGLILSLWNFNQS